MEPSKSFCYLLDYKFNIRTAKYDYCSKANLPAKFTLLDNSGNCHPINQYASNVGSKTLGVCLSMDGNEDAQFESLLKEACTFASQIRSSDVKPNVAFYTLQSSFMKTIEYCLPVTQLTVKAWDEIMKPVMKAALPKSGYSRTIPIPLRYLYSQRYRNPQSFLLCQNPSNCHFHPGKRVWDRVRNK